MLPSLDHLRRATLATLRSKHRQGHATAGLEAQLAALPASYDTLWAFAQTIADLPLRADWPHIEPSDWAGIEAESAPDRPRGLWRA
ncbi:MAG: hypothetical protein H7067_09125, partial [Burkholderiales bacterium]|nr:hypothetical protein [Opitutaceae bacterium]